MNLAAVFGVCLSLLVGSVLLAPHSSVGRESTQTTTNHTTSSAKQEENKSQGSKPTTSAPELKLEDLTSEEVST